MGQKINPIGIRLGVVRDWNAVWYAEGRSFADKLNKDLQVRDMIKTTLTDASVSDVFIERMASSSRVIIHTARPGIVIGRKGADIDNLRKKISTLFEHPVTVNIEEIRKPEMDAFLVSEGICRQLEKRIMFRRAMKRAISNAIRMGAKGIKVAVSGRLNGADIARTEWYREGRVPLHTLRADISYGFCEANTAYGKIGVKVWIFKGEILNKKRDENKSSGSPKPDNRQVRVRRNAKKPVKEA